MSRINTATPHIGSPETLARILPGLRPAVARSVRGMLQAGVNTHVVSAEHLAEAQRILRTRQRMARKPILHTPKGVS